MEGASKSMFILRVIGSVIEEEISFSLLFRIKY